MHKSTSVPFEKANFLGIEIHNCTLSELITFLNLSIIERKKIIVYGTSLASIGNTKWMPELFDFWKKADINIVDGAGLKFFNKPFGTQFKEQVGLPNVADELLKLSAQNGYKVFLLGGTEEINNFACTNIKQRFSFPFACEGMNGYFSENDEEKVCKVINAFQPNILLIGISSPKKENFAYKWKEFLACQVIVLCGGVIDIYAKKTKREPSFIKGLPLAWLYRLVQEPVRLFKPLFIPVLYFSFSLFPKFLISKYFLKRQFTISVNMENK